MCVLLLVPASGKTKSSGCFLGKELSGMKTELIVFFAHGSLVVYDLLKLFLSPTSPSFLLSSFSFAVPPCPLISYFWEASTKSVVL